MAAQSLSARIYWELMRSTAEDALRDHQFDLAHFADTLCVELTRLAGAEIDYAPRCMTAPIEAEPNARMIYVWVPAVLAEEVWHTALSRVGQMYGIMAPMDDWQFTIGPEDYEAWYRSCQDAGAR